MLYDMYANFQNSYYGKDSEPMLKKSQYFTSAPLIVIDCSKQNESLKSAPVDIHLEFKAKENFPEGTSAYCLILHGRIVQYSPVSGDVQKLKGAYKTSEPPAPCHSSFGSKIAIIMDYAVDMQVLKKPGNDFILKDLAFVSLNDDDMPIVYHFKPPFPWRRLTDKYKRENLRLELCYHGLVWNNVFEILTVHSERKN